MTWKRSSLPSRLGGCMRAACVIVFSLPLLAQPNYTTEKARALGQSVAADIRRSAPALGDPLVDAYVKRVGGELARELPDAPIAPTFEVILHPEAKEPLPLPGGIILVPAASLLAARDEDEFAGVLAHAIAHTVSMKPVQSGLGSIPIWFPAHSDSQVNSLLVPLKMLEMRRSQEIDADRLAMQIAARARFDASAFRRYVEREHKADSKFVGLPPRDVRLAEIDATLTGLPAVERRAPTKDFVKAQEVVRRALDEKPRRAPTLRRTN